MEYYFYTLNEYHWLPQQWTGLSIEEKALIIAGIDIRVKREEQERKKAEREAKRKSRH